MGCSLMTKKVMITSLVLLMETHNWMSFLSTKVDWTLLLSLKYWKENDHEMVKKYQPLVIKHFK
jgi:hypothetical protein